jgi:histidinol-phosphatase (PHP family)
MSKIPNYHTHTNYCDGKAKAEEFILAAIEKQQPAIGFSGHAPVPFESWWNMTQENFQKYQAEIQHLKAKYTDKIEVYLAVEADFLAGKVSPANFATLPLDYIIGSIHYLQPESADSPWDFIISPKIFEDGLKNFYNSDIKKLVKDYYDASCKMIESGGFQTIGHCDQIGKFNFDNKYFSENEPFYQNYLNEMLNLISEKNTIVEINTRGRLKNLSEEFYPSLQTLKLCKEKNIRIMLSADAHTPQETDSFLDEAAEVALRAGFETVEIFENGSFKPVRIQNFM